MSLPKEYKPENTEENIYKFWEESGYFNPDNLPGERKESYALLLPPPNVTGELHMGHALNALIQDSLLRMKRMQGYKTLWIPGTDHAGIATQNVVEKKLQKENKTRFDLGREKFIEKTWEWKEKYGNLILNQLKKLGSSCDWSRTVFTMDENYTKAINKAFKHYWEKGLIYEGRRPVNWCSRCQTSLSDLELEHEEKIGKLWYIKYPIKGEDKYITVATTRPETMLGDTAVAVNPEDERYKNLVGKKVILPLVEKEIPIIKDELVDPKFGTGAVKVTPAHDLLDYEIGLKNDLEMIQVIGKNGEITNKAPELFQGVEAGEAREKVIEKIKEENLLEKTEDHEHAIPKCYRCNTTVEITPSRQWFLKMDELGEMAKKAVEEGSIEFNPKNFEKIYFNWLEDIHDWCISRQIWWGHRLPVWECEKGEHFISTEKPEKCEKCGACEPTQVEDVLDTWFSSSLWPFATLGWPEKTNDLETFYPSNVLVTARDIINLWVLRMIFSGLEFMEERPFPKVLIHPTVLTKDGQRMSKSLGTGINPLDLKEKYGADATRFGIAWQVTGLQDMRFDETHIVMGKKFCNKIWNATRFILMQLEEEETFNSNDLKNIEPKTEADKKILNDLKTTKSEMEERLDKFQFGQAAEALYHFFWDEFASFYIEEAKNQIKEHPEHTKEMLLYLVLTSLKLLHPFIPFITEEIYQKLPIENKKETIMIEDWPNEL